jgi:hypothetical protein
MFLKEFTENDKFDFDDKYQNYVYHIDFEKTSMRVFEIQNREVVNIYKKVVEILEKKRRDLIYLVEE